MKAATAFLTGFVHVIIVLALVSAVQRHHAKGRPTVDSTRNDRAATPRLDAYASETARKTDAEIVQTVRHELPKDGKTMTLTTTRSNARGDSIHNARVYERP